MAFSHSITLLGDIESLNNPLPTLSASFISVGENPTIPALPQKGIGLVTSALLGSGLPKREGFILMKRKFMVQSPPSQFPYWIHQRHPFQIRLSVHLHAWCQAHPQFFLFEFQSDPG